MQKPTEDQFWKSFTKNVWEKKSTHVKNFKSSIVDIDQTEIFNMLVEYSDSCRKLNSADGFKLYIDGHMLHPAEVLQYLPEKSDKTLVGYNDRMEEHFKDYCLVCDELLQVSQKNWKKLNQFTKNLFSFVGFPNRFVEMGLYLGNYRKTPFGVHVDGCGVFSFPVIGKKTFRLWSPAFAKKNPSLDRSLNYAGFKKDSTTMVAQHGDMVYWPSSAWHIAESNGSFNATWSLGVWVDRTHSQNIENALKPLVKNKLGILGQTSVIQDIAVEKSGKISSLPKNYIQSISKIKKITEDDLHNTFMRSWLQLLSKQGFKNSYCSDLSKKLSVSMNFQLPDSKVILWSPLKNSKNRLYALNGKTLEISFSKNIQKLVEDLNLGKNCKISNYLKGPNQQKDWAALKTLLSF